MGNWQKYAHNGLVGGSILNKLHSRRGDSEVNTPPPPPPPRLGFKTFGLILLAQKKANEKGTLEVKPKIPDWNFSLPLEPGGEGVKEYSIILENQEVIKGGGGGWGIRDCAWPRFANQTGLGRQELLENDTHQS